MDVNSITSTIPANTAANTAAANQKPAEKQESTAVDVKVDGKPAAVYESSGKTYKPDTKKIQAMWAEHDTQVENFRKLVEGLLDKQAQKNGAANGIYMGKSENNPWKGTAWENDLMVEVDEETRANAQKEIEDGGYYSVEKTAERLLDFAVALSGGDPKKIETLKGAVEKGFEAVEEMWGDELPEISQKTFDAVMEGFDQWEEAGDASAIKLLQDE